MPLENTTWSLSDGSGVATTIQFGKNESTKAHAGGFGTSTVHYPQPTGDIIIDIMWVEDTHGKFMYQTKGPTDPGNEALPTTTGTYTNDVALGWQSNFNAAWGALSISMKKIS